MLRKQSMTQLHCLIYTGNMMAWLMLLPGFSVEHMIAAIAFAGITFIPCMILTGAIIYCMYGFSEHSKLESHHCAIVLSSPSQRKLMDKF